MNRRNLACESVLEYSSSPTAGQTCSYCGGGRLCHVCGGSGTTGGGYACSACGGSGKCGHCGGTGIYMNAVEFVGAISNEPTRK
jgi:hypothetical protein